MKIPYYQIDAFTSSVFSGNPAGVCLLNGWLDDTILQSIAAENNLSETAFMVKNKNGYDLRWFTPKGEIDLCGHATLASAFVIFNYIDPSCNTVCFESKSGLLSVTQVDNLLAMDFPSRRANPCATSEILEKGLGCIPKEVLLSVRDYLVVYDTEDELRGLQPDMLELAKLDHIGIIVTSPGSRSDFVSRFFDLCN